MHITSYLFTKHSFIMCFYFIWFNVCARVCMRVLHRYHGAHGGCQKTISRNPFSLYLVDTGSVFFLPLYSMFQDNWPSNYMEFFPLPIMPYEC